MAYLCWPPDFGGELLVNMERMRTFAERGHSVTALTRRVRGGSRAEQDGAIRLRRCPVAGEGLFARIAYLLWASINLLRMRFDVMHVCNAPGVHAPARAFAAWLFAGIAKMRGARTVSVISLADSETDAWQLAGRTGLFRKFFYQNIDHIVAVSPALYRALARWRPRKALLITCSARDDVFVPLLQEERMLARKDLGIPGDAVVFITIGSAGRRKGHDVLAQAFAQLGEKHPDWFLVLVGPSSRQEGCNTEPGELAEMMAPLQRCAARVCRAGRVDDRNKIRRLLGASDVFVFPTRREGMPIAPMEAMAMGLPVIVSRISNVTDVVCVEEETGLFVPVGNAEALFQAMERLGSDARLRARFGNQARQRIQNEFSWARHVRQWEELYSSGLTVAGPATVRTRN